MVPLKETDWISHSPQPTTGWGESRWHTCRTTPIMWVPTYAIWSLLAPSCSTLTRSRSFRLLRRFRRLPSRFGRAGISRAGTTVATLDSALCLVVLGDVLGINQKKQNDGGLSFSMQPLGFRGFVRLAQAHWQAHKGETRPW